MQPHEISAHYKKRDAQVQHKLYSQFHFVPQVWGFLQATKVAYFKIKDSVGLSTNKTGAALFTF